MKYAYEEKDSSVSLTRDVEGQARILVSPHYKCGVIGIACLRHASPAEKFFLHFLLHNRKKDYLCTRQEKTKYHQTLANEEINQKRIELNVIALAKLLGLGNLDTFMTLQAVSQCLRVSNTWALLKNCSVGSPRPPIQFEVSPRFLLRNN